MTERDPNLSSDARSAGQPTLDRAQLFDRALVAFDRHHARARAIRRSSSVSALVLVGAVVAYFMVARGIEPIVDDQVAHQTDPSMPDSVAISTVRTSSIKIEIVEGDDALHALLDASGECMGFGRMNGALFLIPCGEPVQLPPLQ